MSAAWWRRKPPNGPSELLAKHAGLLDLVIEALVQVHRLSGPEAAQLDAYLRRRLAENDFEILRERGKARFLTFLVVVAERLSRELRDELWARWREEAAVAGNAEIAATLERLVYEGALSFDEALRTAGVVDDPPRLAELQALWARRPWGGLRPILDLKWHRLSTQPAAETAAAGPSDAARFGREPTDLERRLSAFLQRLASHERALLRRRFAEGLSVDELARRTGRPVDELARQIASLLERLGEELVRAGIHTSDVPALLADPRPGYPRSDPGE